MKNTARVEWVDVGKYICIMFVMMSHLQADNDLIRSFYTPFFLTGFFFLAGYVYKQPDSFKTHIIKKIKGLFVPWFIFSNVNILLSSVMSFKKDRNLIKELGLNMVQLRGIGDGLWFIAALFVAFIPFYFVIKYCSKNVAIGLSIILTLLSDVYNLTMPKDFFPWNSKALPWHIEYMFFAMLWMVLGYYFKEGTEEKVDRINSHFSRAIISVVYLFLAYFPFGIKAGTVQSALFVYIIDVVGVLLLVMFSKILRSNWYTRYVGANTLIYFAFHGKVYAVMEHILNSKLSGIYNTILANDIYSTVLAIIMGIVMSFVLMIPAQIINTFFPWMVGRKKRTSK